MILWTVQGRMKGLKDLALREVKPRDASGEQSLWDRRDALPAPQNKDMSLSIKCIYLYVQHRNERKIFCCLEVIKEASFLVYNSKCLHSSLYKKGMCYFKK